MITSWRVSAAPVPPDLWDGLRSAWDAAIKKLGRPMTGFNYYLGLYVKYLIDKEGTPPTPPFLPKS